MTNITLSIDDEVYKKMKDYSEIKWSEYVRKCIKKRIEQLQLIETNWEDTEFLGDEGLLSECWLSDSDEEAFSYLQ
jgi:predicted CopG family antitoxin